MTKREMIEEIAEGIKGVDIENRMKNKKERIQEVYNWYMYSKKEKRDKEFCLNILVVW